MKLASLVPQNLPCLLVARLHEEIILKSMSQTKEKCDSHNLSRSYLWRCRGIPRVHRHYFCLEPTVRKDTWMSTIFATVMVILFENSNLKITWSQLCSKFLLTNYEPYRKQHYERYPSWIIYGHESTYVLNISSRLWQTPWSKNQWKYLEKISCTKIQTCTLKNIAPK